MGFSPRLSRNGKKRKKRFGKNPNIAAGRNGLTPGPEIVVNEAKKKQREEIQEMDKIRKARMREEIFGKGAGLKVSQPGEKHELEADKMADKVMGQSHYQSAQVENERLAEAQPFISKMEDEKMSKAEEEPQAKLQAKEEEVSKAEEENPQAKLQAKEEEVSKAEEEKPQAKLQAKEEEVSKAEEEKPQAKLQAKEEEVSKAEEEKPQAKLQAKEEEVSKAEEEKPQAKLQAKEEEVSKAEEEPQAKLQAKEEEVSKAEEEKIATKAMGKPKKAKKASEGFKHKLDQKAGTGAPLPAPFRAFMERKMGADFAGVRIHTDAQSMKMSKDIHAQAFTYKQDIFFNAGKYSPDSYEGKKLLAHELTHVIQQNDHSKKK